MIDRLEKQCKKLKTKMMTQEEVKQLAYDFEKAKNSIEMVINERGGTWCANATGYSKCTFTNFKGSRRDTWKIERVIYVYKKLLKKLLTE